MYIYIYTYIYTHTHTHTYTHTRIEPWPCGLPPVESGAYRGQRCDRRGVPRADVRVERRRGEERLRAEPLAVDADGKCLHVTARIRVPHRTAAERIPGTCLPPLQCSTCRCSR